MEKLIDFGKRNGLRVFGNGEINVGVYGSPMRNDDGESLVYKVRFLKPELGYREVLVSDEGGGLRNNLNTKRRVAYLAIEEIFG